MENYWKTYGESSINEKHRWDSEEIMRKQIME
jgi:hypothetical protein